MTTMFRACETAQHDWCQRKIRVMGEASPGIGLTQHVEAALYCDCPCHPAPTLETPPPFDGERARGA